MSPRTKFQITLLHIKGEPTHIDVAGALQDARWDVLAVPRGIYQYVGVEGGVKALVSTGRGVTNRYFSLKHYINMEMCVELGRGVQQSQEKMK